MGREIRHVPKGWEHPTDFNGNYIPQYDRPYEEAANEYLNEFLAWHKNTHESLVREPELKQRYPFFWDYGGDPPDAKYYRPAYDKPADCFQVYETVSEGTPKSPVFESKDDLRDWLIKQGYSEASADKFLEYEHAPSFIAFGYGRIKEDISALEDL